MYEFFSEINPVILIIFAAIAEAVILSVMEDRRLARVVSNGFLFVLGAVFYDIGKMHMEVTDRYSFLGELNDYEMNITMYRFFGVLMMAVSIVTLVYYIHKDHLMIHDKEAGASANTLNNTPSASPQRPASSKPAPAEETWECPSCKRKNPNSSSRCGGCFSAKPMF